MSETFSVNLSSETHLTGMIPRLCSPQYETCTGLSFDASSDNLWRLWLSDQLLLILCPLFSGHPHAGQTGGHGLLHWEETPAIHWRINSLETINVSLRCVLLIVVSPDEPWTPPDCVCTLAIHSSSTTLYLSWALACTVTLNKVSVISQFFFCDPV